MSKEWTREIYDTNPLAYVYPEFLSGISPMEILPEEIHGNVLIIGQGGAFPEKTLIATPESSFGKLRSEVSSIYCCDTYYPSSPEAHLDIPCINTIGEEINDPEYGTAYWELSSSYTFLPKTPHDFFDTVLMFRVVDTGSQIQEMGLSKSIAPHLKRGGLFICSGGQFPKVIPEDFYSPLKLVMSVRLSDFNGGYPFTRNTGVVLQK